MDTKGPPGPPKPTGWITGPPPAPGRPGNQLERIFIGAIALLIIGSLLYGPSNTFTAVALLTICTVGIGLLPMLFAAWLVGTVVLAIWEAIKEARGSRGPAIPRDAAKG